MLCNSSISIFSRSVWHFFFLKNLMKILRMIHILLTIIIIQFYRKHNLFWTLNRCMNVSYPFVKKWQLLSLNQDHFHFDLISFFSKKNRVIDRITMMIIDYHHYHLVKLYVCVCTVYMTLYFSFRKSILVRPSTKRWWPWLYQWANYYHLSISLYWFF